MRIDWCRSPTHAVDLAEGQRAVMICRPNGSIFLILIYITILRARYIDLRVEGFTDAGVS